MKEYNYTKELKVYKPLLIPEDSSWDRPRNLYRKFYGWFLDNYRYTKTHSFLDKFLFTPVDNITNGLINFKLWYKVIWQNRDWDWTYILTIYQHKLLLQREYIVTHNRHLEVWKTNRDITLILNLMERVKTEYYQMEHYDYYDFKFRFEPTGDKYLNPLSDSDEEEETFTMETDVTRDDLDTYLNKYKNQVPKAQKEFPDIDFTNKKNAALWTGVYLHNKANALLWQLLSNQLYTFWD